MNYDIREYPDKTTYVDWTSVENHVLQDTNFTFRLNEYGDIWSLKQLVEVCNHQGVTPHITIPNLIDAQADRRFENNHSFGLKLVLQELIGMDAQFSIFHPHNPEVVEMAFEVMGSKVNIIDNSAFIGEVINSLGWYDEVIEFQGKNIRKDLSCVLMSADAGGFKPLMKLCDKINWGGEIFSASKSRKWKDGKTFITQLVDKEDFEGRDILIVDDLCVYGGTFKGLSEILRDRNCGKLYLAVSHMTIQNLKDQPGNPNLMKYFNKVFTTNSKFDNYFVEGKFGEPNESKKLEVIKMF